MQSHQGTFRTKALARIGSRHEWCHDMPSTGLGRAGGARCYDRSLLLRHENGPAGVGSPLTQRKHGDYLAPGVTRVPVSKMTLNVEFKEARGMATGPRVTQA